MRACILILFLCLYQLGQCQISYKSLLTQHFSTGKIEKINRTITITDKEIVVESETSVNSLNKQTFVINETSEKEFPEHGLSRFYVTSSKDNLYTTYFLIPLTDKVEIIDVVQPQQQFYPEKHWRFLID